MNSAGFLPGIVASFCGDQFAYYFGRRPTVWLGTAICAVGCLIISISTSVGMFCGGRAITGFGTSIALTVAPTLLQEIAHPRFRAPLSGFCTQSKALYGISSTLTECRHGYLLYCSNYIVVHLYRNPEYRWKPIMAYSLLYTTGWASNYTSYDGHRP
jgi:MFS family permease